MEENEDPWADNTVAAPPHTEPNREFLSFTIKAGPGYEAPWAVFKFNSMAEAFGTLTDGERTEGSFEDFEDLILAVAKRVQSKYNPATVKAATAAPKASGNSSGYKPRQATSAAPENVPSGVCPTHNCDLVYAEPFVKRDGSKVNARVGCPVPKCYAKTIWQNDDGSWKE